MFTALSWEAWLTLAIVLGLIVALARDVARPELLLFASLAPLLATGVLTADEAFAGFSNSAPLAVGALFVVAAGVQATGALAFTDRLLFRRSAPLGATLGQLMLAPPKAVMRRLQRGVLVKNAGQTSASGAARPRVISQRFPSVKYRRSSRRFCRRR